MVKTIRLDKKENYLIDKNTGYVLDRYDPNNESLQVILKLDDSILTVDASAIKMIYGGQIVIQYNNDRFILDDGYQDYLVKAGYIVYKDFNERKELDRDTGIELNNQIKAEVNSAIEAFIQNSDNETIVKERIDDNQINVSFDYENYHYTCIIETISCMVNKNTRRKDNSLTFYPFDKNMDKYGTLYVSIFGKKIGTYVSDANEKYKTPGNVITEFMKTLNSNYHYEALPVKKRVLNWKNL